MNKINLTWEDITKQVNNLVVKLEPRKREFTGIFGIPRGGLIPAVMLSHILQIPWVQSTDKIMPGTLVVDDIIDTGKTSSRLVTGKNCSVATLYYQEESIFVPDFYGVKLPKDNFDWMIFPWETINSSGYDYTV